MNVVHLTASTFYGGPERQMLGLARHLPAGDRTLFLSFAEGGHCRQFLGTARREGFDAFGLTHDTPHLRAAAREVAGHLERCGADVLCCHGYKSNLVGRVAARRCKIPVIGVSRGWTGENIKVRFYERLDRWHLRFLDRVVCVSEAQAAKVRRARVRAERIRVIHNAVDPSRFAAPDPRYRTKLQRYFRQPRSAIVGAAGRLSPEKGFDVLLAAAEIVLRRDPSAGFILFGEGPGRAELAQRISAAGVAGSFVLTGFRGDLDRFLPHFDLLALPSHTEGLPNVVLEACAAGVPVVATAVGGTPEIIEDGFSGFLVPPNDPATLADRITDALASDEMLQDMGDRGRERVRERFGFVAQARHYRELFEELGCGADVEAGAPEPAAPAPPSDAVTDHLVSAGPTCEP